MNSDSIGRTRDISVLQLLTRLGVETQRLIKLADDINQHASTPQAKTAMNLIGSEVNNILQIVKMSVDPLYNLYEVDPGMKAAKLKELEEAGQGGEEEEFADTQDVLSAAALEDYDENALWSEVKRVEK